ncbi:hypothetical protein H4R18_003100 [Coemansia javaensis]|uniref:Uncharacterized protein n=1 Tax=Coemansia javaensis TaxID=2761396 RepID=A0A9W8LI75_9FUNG|nr:hypothetical protein H4R18_003100 [Coemansia javaensis]
MQFAKVALAIAALAAAVVADIDWTSPVALQCTKENWAALKAKADPLLPSAPTLLTPEQNAALNSILQGQSTLPAEPTDEMLAALPKALPAVLLNSLAGPIVQPCIDAASTQKPTSSAETSSTSSAPVSSSTPASTDAESSSPSASENTDYSVSTPAKCVHHA